MNTLKLPSRTALSICYAVIVLLPCVLILLSSLLPHAAIVVTFLAYAFALLPTYYLDHWLLGGIGFHSLLIFAVLAGVVAAVLWPLLLLSITPALWHSVSWRRMILGYGAAFVLLAILAAWKMLHSAELFFG